MENFFYDDKFCSDLSDLMDVFDIDEENVNVVGYNRYIYSISLKDFDKVDDIYRVNK